MPKNATFDLMATAAVLSKDLHRYETLKPDAKECTQCQELWGYMRQTEEEQLKPDPQALESAPQEEGHRPDERLRARRERGAER